MRLELKAMCHKDLNDLIVSEAERLRRERIPTKYCNPTPAPHNPAPRTLQNGAFIQTTATPAMTDIHAATAACLKTEPDPDCFPLSEPHASMLFAGISGTERNQSASHPTKTSQERCQ